MFFDTMIGRNFVRIYTKNVVVICHGLPYEPLPVIAKGYDELAEFFAERGLNSVIFDFSGTGLSKGKFRVLNWVEDLIEIVGNFKSVHLVGFSLGGIPATYVARLKAVKTLTLVATPCCFEVMREDLIKKAYEHALTKKSLRGVGTFEEFYENFKKDLEEFKPIKWIESVNKPVLIVHGDKDDVIPFESSKRLYEKAKGKKFFLEVKNGGHRLRKYREVMEIIANWIAIHYIEYKGWSEEWVTIEVLEE
jgi:pimeloyl-ACP methyl ester carboxylesterase